MKPEIAIVQQEVQPGIYKGRWGYYPCDYQTYLMLKKIKKLWWKTLRQKATWTRWKRKIPKNRVRREKIRNEKGQVVGWKVLGPNPEPTVNPILSNHVMTTEKQWFQGEGFKDVVVERLYMTGSQFIAAAESCRRPKASPEEVVKLTGFNFEAVKELAAQIDAQESERK